MQAVDRVISVLMCFTDGQAEFGVTEIASELDLPKSAVHRVLESLVSSGLVSKQHERGKYRLGPRAMELSLATLGTVDIRSLALPVMEQMRDDTGETVTLSIRINRQRIYVAQVESRQDVRMTVDIGRRAPLYAGASGRAILMTFSPSELDEYLSHVELVPLTKQTPHDPRALRRTLDKDRARGHTVSVGERDAYAAAVAAPILSRTGHAMGSVSICGPGPRLSGELLARCEDAIAAGAKQISDIVVGG
jgi:DNA-binding IclR family transcriptional regulator